MSKITQELIDKAKKKHKEIYVLEASAEVNKTLSDVSEDTGKQEIEVATGEFVAEKGKVYAIVFKPDRKIIGLAMSYKDPLQMGNSILRNTIVEIDGESYADPEILENEVINMTASTEVMQLIEFGTAKLKKY
jgi:hypothetical protein